MLHLISRSSFYFLFGSPAFNSDGNLRAQWPAPGLEQAGLFVPSKGPASCSRRKKRKWWGRGASPLPPEKR